MRALALFQVALLVFGAAVFADESHAAPAGSTARRLSIREAELRLEARWTKVAELANQSRLQTLERAFTQKDCQFINRQHRLLLQGMKEDRKAALRSLRQLERARMGKAPLAAKIAQISSLPFLEGAIATQLYAEPGLKKEVALLALEWAIADLKDYPALTCLTHDLGRLLQRESDEPSSSHLELAERFHALIDKPDSCAPGRSATTLSLRN